MSLLGLLRNDAGDPIQYYDILRRRGGRFLTAIYHARPLQKLNRVESTNGDGTEIKKKIYRRTVRVIIVLLARGEKYKRARLSG